MFTHDMGMRLVCVVWAPLAYAMLGAKAAGYHGRLIFLANDEQRVTYPQLCKVFKHIIYL
jgi:hypothetical protein